MEAVINALAEVIKAIYVDGNPENGELTDVFYRNKAIKIIETEPEEVIPALIAFDKLKRTVNK